MSKPFHRIRKIFSMMSHVGNAPKLSPQVLESEISQVGTLSVSEDLEHIVIEISKELEDCLSLLEQYQGTHWVTKQDVHALESLGRRMIRVLNHESEKRFHEAVSVLIQERNNADDKMSKLYNDTLARVFALRLALEESWHWVLQRPISGMDPQVLKHLSQEMDALCGRIVSSARLLEIAEEPMQRMNKHLELVSRKFHGLVTDTHELRLWEAFFHVHRWVSEWEARTRIASQSCDEKDEMSAIRLRAFLNKMITLRHEHIIQRYTDLH